MQQLCHPMMPHYILLHSDSFIIKFANRLETLLNSHLLSSFLDSNSETSVLRLAFWMFFFTWSYRSYLEQRMPLTKTWSPIAGLWSKLLSCHFLTCFSMIFVTPHWFISFWSVFIFGVSQAESKPWLELIHHLEFSLSWFNSVIWNKHWFCPAW